MEATAKHNFEPNDPLTELAFQKNDKLNILNLGDPVQWFNAEMNGKTGIVPGNYISITEPNWYMGRIPRSKAEEILSTMHEGAFLVRLSESAPTEFSLSVKCNNSVQHFRILKHNETKRYFLWIDQFNSVNELVEFYKQNSVSKHNNICLREMDGTFVAEAIYDFVPNQNEPSPEEDTELYFRKGDLIHVSDTSDNNWWGGRIGDRQGYFPKLYVKPYSSISTGYPSNDNS